MIITSASPQQTRDFGAAVGALLQPGDVVVLDGELGAGKTTFTQGLGRGLHIAEPITSPTFVLARESTGPHGLLTHVDAYRLTSLVEWDDLDVDVEGGITVIEWGERITAALPDDRLTIRFVAEGDSRQLEVSASGDRSRKIQSQLSDGLRGDA